MKSRSSDQIRQDFLHFFEEKNHLVVEGAPVVPREDPTLLFTNAGMNQFKPIFLGEESGYQKDGKVWNRAVDTQRCIRVSGKHNDLEEVGYDTYHHTLFEMLGNWSFGDYFKKEAIGWAWELLTERWELDPDRLYATVFEGSDPDGIPMDQESVDLWKSETGIDPDHILAFGKRDNFWEMGEVGPCGPCSEVHVDLRDDEERKRVDGKTLVNRDDPRVMEIWNLVFIQYNRRSGGILDKLPAQHVDTGMGFERICAILQGKTSNYDTDLFEPLLKKISDLAGIPYGKEKESDIAMRVIADHIRAVGFAIADGASPSNEGRGYVIRRILRRAIRYGWDRLNLQKPFFHQLVPVLATQFEKVFPVLKEQEEYVIKVIRAEEKSFLHTLGQGIELFHQMAEGRKKLSGEDAFKLHDTYGFPIDLTELMAREKGLDVDRDGFEALMKQQQERGRASGRFAATEEGENWTVLIPSEEFQFTGYDELESESRIVAMRREKDRPAILLDRSPFYAESGGQVPDVGTLESDGQVLRVKDVQKSPRGFLHIVDKLPEDPSGIWMSRVNASRRAEITRHHTATHLMHAALRRILGDHVAQKGSLVEPGRLRFDFSHYEAVSTAQLDEVEALVNEKVRENIERLEERDVPIDEARERGAMMLFGEKYGDRVRIITFDDQFSVELCGGTHVRATGEIGYFRFLNESSVASGVRRVEAVVGRPADDLIRNEKRQVDQLFQVLDRTDDPVSEIQSLIEEKKRLEKELDRVRQKQAAGKLDEWIENSLDLDGVALITGRLDAGNMDTLKQMGYDSLEKQPDGAVTLLSATDPERGKVYLMVSVTPDLIERGLKAGEIVGELGKVVGGGGGGQPSLATAGGRFPEKLDEAFDKAKSLINSKLN